MGIDRYCMFYFHMVRILKLISVISFQDIRSTMQGKLEERLPFVSYVVPEKIKKNYPDAYQNMRFAFAYK